MKELPLSINYYFQLIIRIDCMFADQRWLYLAYYLFGSLQFMQSISQLKDGVNRFSDRRILALESAWIVKFLVNRVDWQILKTQWIVN